MKWQFTVFLSALVLASTGHAASRTNEPDIVDSALTKGLVPVGFDDNDRVQVVVRGTFPSTCYKVGPHEVKVDAAPKTIVLRQKAYRYKGLCLNVTVAFTQVVEVGLLAEGQYAIEDNVSGRAIGNFSVTRSTTSNPDDYLYAPVADAYSETDANGHRWLALTGSFPNRCMRMKEVRISYYPEVIVVQPIAEMVAATRYAPCTQGEFRYSEKVALRDSLNGGTLLHVRSMDGQAINKFIQFH